MKRTTFHINRVPNYKDATSKLLLRAGYYTHQRGIYPASRALFAAADMLRGAR